jgi:hypothetical protein
MTTDDKYTDETLSGLHTPSQAERDLHDLMRTIEGFVGAASIMDVMDTMEEPAASLFYVGLQDMHHQSRDHARIGSALALTALMTSPAALSTIPGIMRAKLIEADPRCALAVGQSPPVPAPVALAVSHEFDGIHCFINPKGELELTTYHPLEGQPGVVKWDAANTFELSLFLGMPGVMDLIKAVHAGRQTKIEIDAQLNEAHEAGRAEALEDAKDMTRIRRHYYEEFVKNLRAVAAEHENAERKSE